MSYSVDLEVEDLRCKSQVDALRAAAIIGADAWMRTHIVVSPVWTDVPEIGRVWHLSIESYDCCSWNEDAARRVWVAIAPHMADGSKLEFRTEDSERFRVLWLGGRALLEVPKTIIWELGLDLTAEASS